jgi:hypothetical protein
MPLDEGQLPNFGDRYLQYFNPDRQQFELRRKSTTSGNLNISECMELIEKLMRKHQLSFVPSKSDKHLVMLPFAFLEPKEGDKILNVVTREVYTVDQIIKNPSTNQWNGLVRLDLISPPSIELRHSLVYQNPDRYIKFDHEYPDALLNSTSANSEGIAKHIPQMLPTITWSIRQKEPGGLGEPFSSRKELKPRLRESAKDPFVPGYTVEIYGQWIDSIIQFDAWSNSFRTSERLVTWIESLLKLYAGYIRDCGIANMLFWRRETDRQENAWRQSIPVKSTQFYFRTEELEAVYQRDILKIDVSLGISEDHALPYTNQFRYIADQLISGNYTPDEYRALFYRSGEYLFGDIDIRH